MIGDMFMIGLQYISVSEGVSLRDASLSPPALEAVWRGVSRALELLHRQDLVFGDLREMNVLNLAEGDRTLLVDFDGVGRPGESKYPAYLNPNGGLVWLSCRSWERCMMLKTLGGSWTGSLGSGNTRFSFSGSNTHNLNPKKL